MARKTALVMSQRRYNKDRVGKASGFENDRGCQELLLRTIAWAELTGLRSVHIIRTISMKYIRLIHWNSAEAEVKASMLRAAGYAVINDDFKGPADLRMLRESPPLAAVIDLTRLPSRGREIAIALRHHKSTRFVPLLFVEGEPVKVERVKKVLPDAVYTTWGRIRSSLRDAIAHPPIAPKVPASIFDAYSDSPLSKKLGIRPNSDVVLIDAPRDFEKMIGALPKGAILRRRPVAGCDLIIWFTATRKGLNQRIIKVKASLEGGKLWIAWPKKAASIDPDLSQTIVRETGLAAGLVDYKICSIDDQWSGLLFTIRKPGQHSPG